MKKNFFKELCDISRREKTILFCDSPSQISKAYNMIAEEVFENREIDFIKVLEEEIHPEWIVVKLLRLGVLTHHGQMPKYIQNKMINMFNSNDEFKILFGTNSISEGINTVTKNLFIHPEYTKNEELLLKNTIGRAGRLGKYPIGYIYSTKDLEYLEKNDISLELAIDSEEEMEEIVASKNVEAIEEMCQEYSVDVEFCQMLLEKYKLSLSRLKVILAVLKENCKFVNITNLPFIAKKIYGNAYKGDPNDETFLIRGYLQSYYNDKRTKERIGLNSFNDRIKFYRYVNSDDAIDATEIINKYMHFIYSTFEYKIMPVVNIGLDIYDKYEKWIFGENVIQSLKKCRDRYYKKIYGDLDVENLSQSHISIISAVKDYGMIGSLKDFNVEILNELENALNVRYSTVDVIRAINRLAKESKLNKGFYKGLKKKYMI